MLDIHESGIVTISMGEVENKLSLLSPEVSISLFVLFDSRNSGTLIFGLFDLVAVKHCNHY